jgi:hypothetical protein
MPDKRERVEFVTKIETSSGCKFSCSHCCITCFKLLTLNLTFMYPLVASFDCESYLLQHVNKSQGVFVEVLTTTYLI